MEPVDRAEVHRSPVSSDVLLSFCRTSDTMLFINGLVASSTAVAAIGSGGF